MLFARGRSLAQKQAQASSIAEFDPPQTTTGTISIACNTSVVVSKVYLIKF